MCSCIKWLPSPHICLLILQLHPFIDSHTRKLISISYNIGVISCVHLAHIHKLYCFMPTQRQPSYEPAWHSSLGSYSVEKLLEVEKAGIGQVFWQPFWCPCPTGSQPLEIRLHEHIWGFCGQNTPQGRPAFPAVTAGALTCICPDSALLGFLILLPNFRFPVPHRDVMFCQGSANCFLDTGMKEEILKIQVFR